MTAPYCCSSFALLRLYRVLNPKATKLTRVTGKAVKPRSSLTLVAVPARLPAKVASKGKVDGQRCGDGKSNSVYGKEEPLSDVLFQEAISPLHESGCFLDHVRREDEGREQGDSADAGSRCVVHTVTGGRLSGLASNHDGVEPTDSAHHATGCHERKGPIRHIVVQCLVIIAFERCWISGGIPCDADDQLLDFIVLRGRPGYTRFLEPLNFFATSRRCHPRMSPASRSKPLRRARSCRAFCLSQPAFSARRRSNAHGLGSGFEEYDSRPRGIHFA